MREEVRALQVKLSGNGWSESGSCQMVGFDITNKATVIVRLFI
jgi:hypothetical protein